MARPTGKKGPKPASTTSNPPPKSSSTTPPSPFVYAPPKFTKAFLSTLPQPHVYLAHIDTTPRILKRRVFLVPLCMNLVIAAILAVRIYYAAPTYFALIVTIFGYDSPATVDTEKAGLGDLMSILSGRTSLLMMDYALFALLGSWPWEFMFGNERSRYIGPLEWRRQLGFPDKEIIIRRARKWDESLKSPWTLDDELTLKHKMTPAMEKSYIAKTGYLLLDKDWDLDFAAMLKASQLVQSGELQFSDFDSVAMVHYQKQWLTWHVHKLEDTVIAKDSEIIRTFKDKLTAMGCEDLFYRWIELVQYESSGPGGFTEGRKASAMRELRRLMTERGLDYGKFEEEIGGSKGMPGLEE